MEEEVVKNMNQHNNHLSPYACKDREAIRFFPEEEDIRTPFFRDIDRILYSYSYHRYSDKTQVFKGRENDHITKRMLHVQYVSKIARTIGRALGLNEDLIEAASLGHDLGHVPFGHFGESVLNELSLQYQEGYFHHNAQSVRLLMYLEENGKGLNLTLQVLDAILCHNGEFVLGEYYPRKKTKGIFLEEYQKTFTQKDFGKTLVPMTLEGCVVRLSDIIGYLGRDIEDACILKRFDKKDIPKEIRSVLGTTNREIVNTIVLDVISNSIDKPYIKMSDKIYDAVKALKKFNYENIYDCSLTKEEQGEIRSSFQFLFSKFLEDLKMGRKESRIYTAFLNYKNEEYLNHTSHERCVIDFLAGMTDEYFISCCTMMQKEHTKD